MVNFSRSAFRWIYAALWVIRVLFALYGTGYIHPDEHMQNAEITAGTCGLRINAKAHNDGRDPSGHPWIPHDEILGVEPSFSPEGCHPYLYDIWFTILLRPKALLYAFL